jgi:hypothetical protein
MTLFGDDETAVPAKKAKRPKMENADAVARIEERYVELFAQRWGFAPLRNYGRERKALGELERQEGWGEQAVLDLLPVYFTTADRKIVSGDYSLSDFCRNAQFLRQLGKRVSVDPRMADNIAAARRVVGRHK